jgi:hypothetical protein
MSFLQRFKDKKQQDAVRRMRSRSARHQGATSWREKRDHASRLKGFFGTPTGQWLKKDGWALAGIVVIVFGALVYYFFFSSAQKVTAVEVSETVFLDGTAVQESVESHLATKRFGLLPRSARVVVSEDKIAERVMSEFADTAAIESVVVTETDGTLLVDITERVPSVTWIAKGDKKKGRVYTVDQNGVVTHELSKRKDANPGYPVIIDRNRDHLGIDWPVVSPEYLSFVMEMHSTFTDTTGYDVQEYVMPAVDCHQKEYVAEEVFEKEISESESEEAKERKRDVQERFQRGEISIDQSIELLEQINADGAGDKKDGSKGDVDRIEFEAVNVPVNCDLVTVAHDVTLKAVEPVSERTFDVRYDATQPVEKQLQHVLTVLRTQVEDVGALEYIDVRIPDRVYYQ